MLEELKNSTAPVPKKLNAEAGKSVCHSIISGYSLEFLWIAAKADPIPKVSFVDNEPEFRWALLADQMAFDKLHEGIVKFAADAVTLKEILKKKLEN